MRRPLKMDIDGRYEREVIFLLDTESSKLSPGEDTHVATAY
jgi:hypothetical protein